MNLKHLISGASLAPKQLAICVWGLITLLLFSPAALLQRFGLSGLVETLAPLLGISFFLLSAYFISETLLELIGFSLRKLRESTKSRLISAKLKTLDHQERAILREFFIQRQNTIALPQSEPAVKSLINAGVLSRSVLRDESDLSDYKGYTIDQAARPLLTSKVLNLPVNGMNESHIQYLKATRPEFVLRDIRMRRRKAA